jgi:spore maturation protein CgeB
VDAPATLARIDHNADDPFRYLIPQYDYIFAYGGGPPVIQRYRHYGARTCHPIYNALDPDTHYPVPPDAERACDLAFIGHRLPDREQRVEQFFLHAAELAPELRFILGGEGWAGKPLPKNVRWIGHVGTADHNRVNCSARMILNVNRASMADVGFSPPTRIFEAAGAGACVITDAWAGIENFFSPGAEILVASSAEEVVGLLRSIELPEARRIGLSMRERALRDHTYALRAAEVHRILQAATVGRLLDARAGARNGERKTGNAFV